MAVRQSAAGKMWCLHLAMLILAIEEGDTLGNLSLLWSVDAQMLLAHWWILAEMALADRIQIC